MIDTIVAGLGGTRRWLIRQAEGYQMMHRRCGYGTMILSECMKCTAEEQPGRGAWLLKRDGPGIHAWAVLFISRVVL